MGPVRLPDVVRDISVPATHTQTSSRRVARFHAYLDLNAAISGSSHTRKPTVSATKSHCRGVLGRTPSTYGPAIQVAPSNTNHVTAELIACTGHTRRAARRLATR